MSMKRLLVIDDEIPVGEIAIGTPTELVGYMSYYLQDLRDAGFEVTAAPGTDEALTILDKDHTFDLAIIDIMMPPGETFASDDVARGMRTGILLAQRICKKWPDLPLVILSNIKDERHQELIEQKIVRKVLFKLDTTPSELVDYIQEVLQEGFS